MRDAFRARLVELDFANFAKLRGFHALRFLF